MNPALTHRLPASDVAANFWPDPRDANGHAPRSRTSSSAAVNLYGLFVHEVSLLVAGACRADQMARVFFSSISTEQIRLRQLVLGLAQAARGCLPALPPALAEGGLVLLPLRNRVVDVLLSPVNPQRGRTLSAESTIVVGANTVSAFSDVALHFEAATARAAEDAHLLGSERLHQVLTSWAGMWSDYLHELRLRQTSFRAQAYAAGLDTRPCRQVA